MNTFDFKITSTAHVSSLFKERGIYTFTEACTYIQQLPYKRNRDKNNLSTVLTDGYGTCSTKHALLYGLAAENKMENEVQLILGIFKMSAANTPAVAATLAKYGLDHIPEAHNYLAVKGERIDCTKANFGLHNFVDDLMSEIVIRPEQITDFKVSYHRDVLKNWLAANPGIQLSFEEIWVIREQCIADLSGG